MGVDIPALQREIRDRLEPRDEQDDPGPIATAPLLQKVNLREIEEGLRT